MRFPIQRQCTDVRKKTAHYALTFTENHTQKLKQPIIVSSEQITIVDYMQYLYGWMIADIKAYEGQFSSTIATGSSNRTKSPGDLNRPTKFEMSTGCLSVPMTLALLSAIETLGYCLTGEPYLYRTDQSATQTAVKKIYDVTLIAFTSTIEPEEVEELVKRVRHRTAHEFFLQKGYSMDYITGNNHLFVTDTGTRLINRCFNSAFQAGP